MDGLGNCLLLLQAGTTAPSNKGWLILAALLIIFVVPPLLGYAIGRLLRLPDLSGKIGVVLMSLFMAVAPFVYQEIAGRMDEARVLKARAEAAEKDKDAPVPEPYQRKTWADAVHMGIDLAGGTNLVYAINVKEAKEQGKTVDKATVDKMVQAIAQRINPSGTEEVTVRRVGNDRIEVIIPGADPDLVKQKKALIVKLGSLEFGIVANGRDHQSLIEQANKRPPNQNEVLSKDGKILAAWCDVKDGKEGDVFGDIAVREVTRRDKDLKEIKVQQYLIVKDPPERAVTGKSLTRAHPQSDENGAPAVGFTLNAQGAVRMQNLTGGRNMPDPTDGFKRRMAILLDGKVHSAPNLKDRISNSGQISGDFTRAAVDELVGVLNAGALEVPLVQEPISEFTISPLLGIDVKEKGINAIVISAAAVFIFMLVYYLVAGVIADLCLTLNLILVVGAMTFISAAFTLPGLAGLVLTIGMAVDSNVLIYERMREELGRGVSLRMAIQNGFDKALAAIIDSNVTTLITAVILYMIGSDLIKGFAVTLFIGLTVSLFSCLYFGHLCFTIVERKRWVKTLKMLQFIGETNVNFLSKRMVAYAFSAILICIGMGALFARGASNMDIDFSGGTMVTFEFVEPQTTDEVRSQLEDAFPNGVSLERLTLAGEQQTAAGGRRFRIRTTEQNQKVVSQTINKTFSDPKYALVRVTMDKFSVDAISGTPEGDAAKFAGGNQAKILFNGPLSEAIVAEYVTKQLESISGSGARPKYDAVQLFLAVRGTVAAKRDPNLPSVSSPKFTEFDLRAMKEIDATDLNAALASIQSTLASEPVFEEVNAFDTSVADETKRDALLAVLASLVMIIGYIWFRFEKVYFGYAAVAALAHDVLVTLGCIALGAYLSKTPLGPFLFLEDFKINMGQIACLLTIVGYSLNDTIVIFDRIREIKGKHPHITYDMINLSVNQTLSRTILTALTVFIVVVVLYVFGGEGIHGFAFSMIIGTLTGAYSTIYIANPVLLWLVERAQKAPTKKPA